MDTATRTALALERPTTAADHTIDITTTGRRSGEPRRIEIWFFRVGDANYITGRPGPRGWFANLEAHPDFTFHLKNGVRADLPATAVPITETAERERVFTGVLDALGEVGSSVGPLPPLEDWVGGSPLVEVRFADA